MNQEESKERIANLTKEKEDLKKKFEKEQASRIRAEKANWVLEDKLGKSHLSNLSPATPRKNIC